MYRLSHFRVIFPGTQKPFTHYFLHFNRLCTSSENEVHGMRAIAYMIQILRDCSAISASVAPPTGHNWHNHVRSEWTVKG